MAGASKPDKALQNLLRSSGVEALVQDQCKKCQRSLKRDLVTPRGCEKIAWKIDHQPAG